MKTVHSNHKNCSIHINTINAFNTHVQTAKGIIKPGALLETMHKRGDPNERDACWASFCPREKREEQEMIPLPKPSTSVPDRPWVLSPSC
jgi:hypothetical protein